MGSRDGWDEATIHVTVLGCGTSTGVPVVGCTCAVCTSDEPRNRRTRPSLLLRLEAAGAEAPVVVLIDTSPDLRIQCLREGVDRVDAVLFTHGHADHVFGLDDLRPFNFRQGGAIPCYGSTATLEQLRRTFAYVFDGDPGEGGGKPRLVLEPIAGAFQVPGFDLEIEAVPVFHGSLEVYAYRFGDFAYVTDCNHIPEASLGRLAGVDTLILDALRYRPHPTHFSIDEALAVAGRLGARQTWFTHMNHDVDYRTTDLPPGVELAYDGLAFSVC
ncbi:MAG: MBL fold metallo-hydrolase [Acidobacteriota bacterium]